MTISEEKFKQCHITVSATHAQRQMQRHGVNHPLSSQSFRFVDTVIISLKRLESLRGTKVNMFTRTYPHKPLRKIKVTICNHQADSPLCLWPDV